MQTDEVDRLVKLVESEVKSGEKLAAAMKAAFQAVLWRMKKDTNRAKDVPYQLFLRQQYGKEIFGEGTC
ncbi:MAG: hypothetical protein EXS27_00760 [Pedosphaera sp.]|nr:hypothetical protein [Pedosphaera sp.]